ncbi:hypothetical protein ACV33W_27890 [Pseudomonas aeruginosa]
MEFSRFLTKLAAAELADRDRYVRMKKRLTVSRRRFIRLVCCIVLGALASLVALKLLFGPSAWYVAVICIAFALIIAASVWTAAVYIKKNGIQRDRQCRSLTVWREGARPKYRLSRQLWSELEAVPTLDLQLGLLSLKSWHSTLKRRWVLLVATIGISIPAGALSHLPLSSPMQWPGWWIGVPAICALASLIVLYVGERGDVYRRWIALCELALVLRVADRPSTQTAG